MCPAAQSSSNQIRFIGLVSSKYYYKRPNGVVCKPGHVNVCRGNGLWEGVGYMGTSGNRDSQLASRSVLKDFTDDALTISAGSLIQDGTARTMHCIRCSIVLVKEVSQGSNFSALPLFSINSIKLHECNSSRKSVHSCSWSVALIMYTFAIKQLLFYSPRCYAFQ